MAVFLKVESERLRAYFRLFEAHKNGRKIPPVAIAVPVLANQGDPGSARSMMEEAHRLGVSWGDMSLVDETRIVLVSLRLAAVHGDWRQLSLFFSGKLREQLTFSGKDDEKDEALLRNFRAFAIDYIIQGLLYGSQFSRALSIFSECKGNTHPHTMRILLQAMSSNVDFDKIQPQLKDTRPYLTRMVAKYHSSSMRQVTRADFFRSL